MVASMYVFNAFWMRYLPQFQPALADFEQAALVYPLFDGISIRERTGAVISVADYGRPMGPWFETWPGHRLLWH